MEVRITVKVLKKPQHSKKKLKLEERSKYEGKPFEILQLSTFPPTIRKPFPQGIFSSTFAS